MIKAQHDPCSLPSDETAIWQFILDEQAVRDTLILERNMWGSAFWNLRAGIRFGFGHSVAATLLRIGTTARIAAKLLFGIPVARDLLIRLAGGSYILTDRLIKSLTYRCSAPGCDAVMTQQHGGKPLCAEHSRIGKGH